jgi:hypothetical protein
VRPQVTVRPSGLISFDPAAVEAFGLASATHAVLYFDSGRKTIGVKPVSKGTEEGAFKLSQRRGSVGLKAPDFFARFGLDFSKAQSFEVGRDEAEEMLTINVKKVPRRRGRRPKTV